LVNSFLIDTQYRLDLNDNILNFYCFFWTNAWYLFPFLISYSLIYLGLFLYRSNVFSVKILLVFIFFYFYELSDLLLSSYSLDLVNLNLLDTNILLSNNINKYHPFIFYFSFWSLLLILINKLSIVFKCEVKFLCNTNQIIDFKIIKTLMGFNIVALFLGSWWALQEGTWGGWWGWDPSEVFGLLFLLFSFEFFHRKLNFNYNSPLRYQQSIYLVFIFITYYFIQLNFDLVSHNFGTHFFFFFNNNFFLLELLLLLVFFMFILLKKYFNNKKNFFLLQFYNKIKKTTNPLHYYTIIMFTSYFVVLVFISFNLLLNFFIWNFFKIQMLNLNNSLYFFHFLFLILFLVSFFNFNLTLYLKLLPFIIVIVKLWLLFIIILSSFNYSILNLLHWLFFLFFLDNNFNSELVVTDWFIFSYYDDIIVQMKLNTPTQFNFNLTSVYFEYSLWFFNDLTKSTFSFMIYFFDKNFTTNAFNYLLSNTSLNSLLLLNENDFILSLLISSFYESRLLTIFIVGLLVTYKFLFRPTKFFS